MRRMRLGATIAVGLLLAALGRAGAAEPTPAIAIVTAPGPARALDLAQLALVFRRKKLVWSDGLRVTPVNLQATDPLRLLFTRVVLGTSPPELERYWNDMYFHGISPPHVLASQEAVLRFVSQTPGAVGYVSACEVDARVQVVLALTAAGPIAMDAATAGCPKRTPRPAAGTTP